MMCDQLQFTTGFTNQTSLNRSEIMLVCLHIPQLFLWLGGSVNSYNTELLPEKLLSDLSQEKLANLYSKVTFLKILEQRTHESNTRIFIQSNYLLSIKVINSFTYEKQEIFFTSYFYINELLTTKWLQKCYPKGLCYTWKIQIQCLCVCTLRMKHRALYLLSACCIIELHLLPLQLVLSLQSQDSVSVCTRWTDRTKKILETVTDESRDLCRSWDWE